MFGMKKTAPPTLGLAGNNAGGNGASGLHGGEIGRATRGNQAPCMPARYCGQKKEGGPKAAPIALEAKLLT